MSVSPPTYHYEDVAATALRQTMLGIPSITSIVNANNIYWLGVETDDIRMPYISIDYSMGGWEKDELQTHSADVIMKMCMYTTNKAVADNFSKAIKALHHAQMDLSDFVNVIATAAIFEEGSIREVDKGQNIPVYCIGGYYCLRFVVN